MNVVAKITQSHSHPPHPYLCDKQMCSVNRTIHQIEARLTHTVVCKCTYLPVIMDVFVPGSFNSGSSCRVECLSAGNGKFSASVIRADKNFSI